MTGRLNSAQPYALGLFRIVVGLLFACHGASKLFGAFGGRTVDAGAWPNWYAAVIELVGGSLVLLGLGTRAAAFISSGAMAYAYFKVHQPSALWPIENSGEGAAMYCWAMFLLIFTGSGAFGLDRLFAKRRTPVRREERAAEPVAA
ncbi:MULTISPECIES: DoxX family protein [unclassified Streptomyces]|uniref:DoxX family protein n=1 Tax=unclassified Streptomyces TaxID=2593676 RepID=UPI001661B98B|nr:MULTISPECIES: DoxX family protein [unclassified Streptomyces]MBD0837409.1 DoxX family protein [Streptomyces sp. TRM68416]